MLLQILYAVEEGRFNREKSTKARVWKCCLGTSNQVVCIRSAGGWIVYDKIYLQVFAYKVVRPRNAQVSALRIDYAPYFLYISWPNDSVCVPIAFCNRFNYVYKWFLPYIQGNKPSPPTRGKYHEHDGRKNLPVSGKQSRYDRPGDRRCNNWSICVSAANQLDMPDFDIERYISETPPQRRADWKLSTIHEKYFYS